MTEVSSLQKLRYGYQPKLPALFIKSGLKVSVVEGAATSSAGDPDAIRSLFPSTFGRPIVTFQAGAGSEAKPLKVNGKVRLKPGMWGKAMLCGDGEGAELDYSMAANMPVPRPGSLSFWICPLEWKRAAKEMTHPDLTPTGRIGLIGPTWFPHRRRRQSP